MCYFNGLKLDKIKKEDLQEKILLAKNGNELAFEEILGHYYPAIIHATSSVFVFGEETEDLVQECAIKLINLIKTYDESKGTFSHFVGLGLKNKMITMMNRGISQKRRPRRGVMPFRDVNVPDWIARYSVAGFDQDCLFKLIKKDQNHYLLKQLEEILSKKELQIFKMRFFHNLSYKDIAKKIFINKNISDERKSVDNAICRIMSKVRKIGPKMKEIEWGQGHYRTIDKISRNQIPRRLEEQEDQDSFGWWSICIRILEGE